MFPWVYGFTWDAGNIIFLGIFFLVVGLIAGTVALASLRAYRNFKLHKHEMIRWHEDFSELPHHARRCRHELTGELNRRTCPNAFDCRQCTMHRQLLDAAQEAAAARAAQAPGTVRPRPATAGMDVPLDRLYHRGHTWVRMEEDGTAVVGLDDLARRLLGAPEQVDFPAVGSQVRVNGLGWRMHRLRSDVRVLSPVDGRVLETGGPEKGWYLRVQPVTAGIDTRHLLHGNEVRSWMAHEMDRLRAALGGTSLPPTLADGGEPVADFTKSLPDADWDRIWGEMLLEP